MRILVALTYYAPHISGLTVYAQRLYKHLLASGHEVTVLTSHYSSQLPKTEALDGTTVIRSPVLLRANKGVLMPLFPWQALRLVASHDIVHLHLPQIEASLVAIFAKLLRRPIVVTYQCDIILPSRRARLAFSWLISLSHWLTCLLADRIVAISEDYAANSTLLRRFRSKVVSTLPLIEVEESRDPSRSLRERYELGGGPLIGFVGRFAEDKGIGTLVDSVPHVRRGLPNAKYVLVGLTDRVPGERVYESVQPKIEQLGPTWTHLGVLSDAELAEFYRTIDVLVLPSINSTESFGMTQAEAMLMGTPVVTSDLPGVREAIRVTGMGELVPPGDEVALAKAILAVLRDPEPYARPKADIRKLFDSQQTVNFYEQLFSDLLGVEPVAGEPSKHTVAPARDAKAPRSPRAQ
ncbi:MAG: glycosyltransferase family 4 protein [Planctomycetes bacterium]|nr:glycosyltransferase family 4 protein [Planctomycetota bacterium]